MRSSRRWWRPGPALRRGDEVHDVRPWLYRIVRNAALNQLRVAGYDLDELVDTLAAAEDPEEEVERRALVRQTLAAVAALPERQRDALLRTAVEGRGQDEVARDLGLTDTAVRQLVHRARVSVRAAATAVVPLPAAAWLASAAPRAEPMAARIVELVAGSSAAGATLAKAGTLAVLAGTAVSAPTLVDQHPADPPPARERQASVAKEPAAAVAEPMREEAVPPPASPEPSPTGGREHDRAGSDRGDRDESRADRRRDQDAGDEEDGRDDRRGESSGDDHHEGSSAGDERDDRRGESSGDDHHEELSGDDSSPDDDEESSGDDLSRDDDRRHDSSDDEDD
jgi:Sigma-70, region 4